MKQALKGKDYRMVQWKSDWLIVLGAWESRVHGEAASSEALVLAPVLPTH